MRTNRLLLGCIITIVVVFLVPVVAALLTAGYWLLQPRLFNVVYVTPTAVAQPGITAPTATARPAPTAIPTAPVEEFIYEPGPWDSLEPAPEYADRIRAIQNIVYYRPPGGEYTLDRILSLVENPNANAQSLGWTTLDEVACCDRWVVRWHFTLSGKQAYAEWWYSPTHQWRLAANELAEAITPELAASALPRTSGGSN